MPAHPYEERIQGWRFYLFNLVLQLGHALILFNAGAYIATLPHVAGGFGVVPSFGTWTQTDFMIGLGLAFPLSSWFSRRLGEVRLLVLVFIVFAGISTICALTSDYPIFLLSRILLGLAGGITIPVSQSLLLQEYPEHRRLTAISLWGLVTLIPFTLGGTVGGWLADTFGWRSLFVLNVPVALAVAGITDALLYGHKAHRTTWQFDLIGYVFVLIFLLGIQTLLNMGNDFDWLDSPWVVTVTIVIAITFVSLVVWELGTPYPAIELRLFEHRNFTIAFICLTVSFFYIQGLLSLFIVQLQLLLGYPSLQAGLVFLPMVIFAKPIAWFSYRLVKRIDARLLASFSLFGFAVTYWWIGQFDRADSFAQIFWPQLLKGVFLGGFLVPLTALLLSDIPAKRHLRAIEFTNLARICAGALGITFQGVIFYRRTPFHLRWFNERFSLFNPLTDDILDKFKVAGYSEPMAVAKLGRVVTQRAALLALNDAFFLAGLVFVGLAVLVWFAHPVRR